MAVIQSGLVSQYDWTALIEAMIEIKSRPMLKYQENQNDVQTKLTALQSINTKLLALKDASEAMDTADEFLVKDISSSDTEILKVSASSEAATGAHSIIVNKLAKAAKEIHETGWNDMNTTAVTDGADGVFQYTLGDSDTITIDVPEGTTLSGLRALINNDASNPGVTATVIDDGGDTEQYHLILTSDDTGSSNSITIVDGDPGQLSSFTDIDFGTTQAAQDAEVRVDGYPGSGWITRETNTVSDLIEGVTLTLLAEDPLTPVDVTISNDVDGVITKVNSFVKAYNDVQAEIHGKTMYDVDLKIAGPLLGDSTSRGIQSDIQRLIASVVPGLSSSTVYDSLSRIGIQTSDYGELTVDTATLTDALEDDFEGVGDLFAESWENSPTLAYVSRTSKTQGGEHAVEADWVGGVLQEDSCTINGHPATVDGDYLVGADGYPEEGLRIRCTDPGSDTTVTGTVRLGTGVAVQMSNRLTYITDPQEGPIAWAEDSYEDAIAGFQDRIDEMGKRLVQEEAMLTEKFIALEMLISKITTTTNYFTQWSTTN